MSSKPTELNLFLISPQKNLAPIAIESSPTLPLDENPLPSELAIFSNNPSLEKLLNFRKRSRLFSRDVKLVRPSRGLHSSGYTCVGEGGECVSVCVRG